MAGLSSTARQQQLVVSVKPSQVANPRNEFCIEQRATAKLLEKPKEARVRVFGLFLLLPRLAPVGLTARKLVSEHVGVLVRLSWGHS